MEGETSAAAHDGPSEQDLPSGTWTTRSVTPEVLNAWNDAAPIIERIFFEPTGHKRRPLINQLNDLNEGLNKNDKIPISLIRETASDIHDIIKDSKNWSDLAETVGDYQTKLESEQWPFKWCINGNALCRKFGIKGDTTGRSVHFEDDQTGPSGSQGEPWPGEEHQNKGEDYEGEEHQNEGEDYEGEEHQNKGEDYEGEEHQNEGENYEGEERQNKGEDYEDGEHQNESENYENEEHQNEGENYKGEDGANSDSADDRFAEYNDRNYAYYKNGYGNPYYLDESGRSFYMDNDGERYDDPCFLHPGFNEERYFYNWEEGFFYTWQGDERVPIEDPWPYGQGYEDPGADIEDPGPQNQDYEDENQYSGQYDYQGLNQDSAISLDGGSPFWDFAALTREIRNIYGLNRGGNVLGWNKHEKAGYSVIVKIVADSAVTARIEPARFHSGLTTSEDTHIALNERGKRRTPDGEDWEWPAERVTGFGLVAWRVDEKYVHDPVCVLTPGHKTYCPMTYIQVFWDDGQWTWESRNCFRQIIKQEPYLTDTTIYHMADEQEFHFTKEQRENARSAPVSLPGRNPHWRNTQTPTGAYYDRSHYGVREFVDEGYDDRYYDDKVNYDQPDPYPSPSGRAAGRSAGRSTDPQTYRSPRQNYRTPPRTPPSQYRPASAPPGRRRSTQWTPPQPHPASAPPRGRSARNTGPPPWPTPQTRQPPQTPNRLPPPRPQARQTPPQPQARQPTPAAQARQTPPRAQARQVQLRTGTTPAMSPMSAPNTPSNPGTRTTPNTRAPSTQTTPSTGPPSIFTSPRTRISSTRTTPSTRSTPPMRRAPQRGNTEKGKGVAPRISDEDQGPSTSSGNALRRRR
jgi:hypothetical protein